MGPQARTAIWLQVIRCAGCPYTHRHIRLFCSTQAVLRATPSDSHHPSCATFCKPDTVRPTNTPPPLLRTYYLKPDPSCLPSTPYTFRWLVSMI